MSVFMVCLNMKRVWLIAVLLWSAYFFCGCGQKKHDAPAREILKTAEARQSLADVTALIRVCADHPDISVDIRKQCVLQASVIIQKHITQSRAALDEKAVADVVEVLSDDAVSRLMPIEPMLEQVDEAQQYIRLMRVQQRSAERHKKLRQLQEVFRGCELQEEFLNAENLAALTDLYIRFSPEVMKKHFAQYIEYGNLWLNKEPLDMYPDLQILLKKNLAEGCSRCRQTGKEFCQVCGGNGVCRICKGSGYKSMYKHINFSSGGSWSYQQGWKEDRSRKHTGGEKLTECSKKCIDCQGVGSLKEICGKCEGRKYLLNRKLLASLLQEQFQQIDALLAELVFTFRQGDDDIQL